jgi:hypothetical protein
MNTTDIGHSDASQNYEKMGTEFILSLLFDENIRHFALQKLSRIF